MPALATVSTYCLVANCNSDTGSCVTVTDVRPVNTVAAAPLTLTLVLPILTIGVVQEGALVPVL